MKVFPQPLGILLVVGLAASPAYAERSLVVPADVYEVEVSRMNGVLLRYIRFFDYPCLRLETLVPSKDPLSIHAQKDVCSITPKGDDPVTFEKNVTSVVPREIRENDTSFSFRAEYVLAEVSAPIFYTDCEVEVKETGDLGKVQCGKKRKVDLDTD